MAIVDYASGAPPFPPETADGWAIEWFREDFRRAFCVPGARPAVGVTWPRGGAACPPAARVSHLARVAPVGVGSSAPGLAASPSTARCAASKPQVAASSSRAGGR